MEWSQDLQPSRIPRAEGTYASLQSSFSGSSVPLGLTPLPEQARVQSTSWNPQQVQARQVPQQITPHQMAQGVFRDSGYPSPNLTPPQRFSEFEEVRGNHGVVATLSNQATHVGMNHTTTLQCRAHLGGSDYDRDLVVQSKSQQGLSGAKPSNSTVPPKQSMTTNASTTDMSVILQQMDQSGRVPQDVFKVQNIPPMKYMPSAPHLHTAVTTAVTLASVEQVEFFRHRNYQLIKELDSLKDRYHHLNKELDQSHSCMHPKAKTAIAARDQQIQLLSADLKASKKHSSNLELDLDFQVRSRQNLQQQLQSLQGQVNHPYNTHSNDYQGDSNGGTYPAQFNGGTYPVPVNGSAYPFQVDGGAYPAQFNNAANLVRVNGTAYLARVNGNGNQGQLNPTSPPLNDAPQSVSDLLIDLTKDEAPNPATAAAIPSSQISLRKRSAPSTTESTDDSARPAKHHRRRQSKDASIDAKEKKNGSAEPQNKDNRSEKAKKRHYSMVNISQMSDTNSTLGKQLGNKNKRDWMAVPMSRQTSSSSTEGGGEFQRTVTPAGTPVRPGGPSDLYGTGDDERTNGVGAAVPRDAKGAGDATMADAALQKVLACFDAQMEEAELERQRVEFEALMESYAEKEEVIGSAAVLANGNELSEEEAAFAAAMEEAVEENDEKEAEAAALADVEDGDGDARSLFGDEEDAEDSPYLLPAEVEETVGLFELAMEGRDD